MKTLYLHCGYHKSGSSFLQTMFVRNRAYLEEHGLHFPISEREYDMISGNISPGNGPELAKALSEVDSNRVRGFLETRFKQAAKEGCHKVLLSSEGLFHSFAEDGALECLMEVCGQLDIDSIEALIYFRDPVSHAISTYKHRAKNGNIDDFGDWLNEEYETMELLEKFTVYRSKHDITWSCRKYRADSEFMARSSFVDWLGLDMPEIPQDDKVNVSVSLSEIRIIQSLKKIYPEAIEYLKDEFKNLSVNDRDKENEKTLSNLYGAMASNKLMRYQRLVQKVNESLENSEALILPIPDRNVMAVENTKLYLNEQQLRAMCRAMKRYFESDRLLSKIQLFLKKISQKLNRQLIRK